MPLPLPEFHRSVRTGRPESACNVSGAMNWHAAGVITTSTVMPACTNRRVSSAALYAAMPPVSPSTTRRRGEAVSSGVGRAVDAEVIAPEFTLGPSRARAPRPPEKPLRSMSVAILDWPVAERPRERLCARGVGALSDAELLAVVLGTGAGGANAVDVARELIAQLGSLAAVLAAPCAVLAAARGMGLAKAARVVTVLELARRVLIAEAAQADVLASPQAVRDYLRLALASRPYEVFVGLYLDSQNRVLGIEELFRGTLAQTSVYPREVVKAALARNAAAMIFAHNHPSGVAEPSRADELLTQALRQALALVDIRTLDHFVVAGARLVSFAERGLL